MTDTEEAKEVIAKAALTRVDVAKAASDEAVRVIARGQRIRSLLLGVVATVLVLLGAVSVVEQHQFVDHQEESSALALKQRVTQERELTLVEEQINPRSAYTMQRNATRDAALTKDLACDENFTVRFVYGFNHQPVPPRLAGCPPDPTTSP